ncbi:hypothetical protein [Vulcanococcus limneticus]|uniref:hypothetical protein n=1 Tax=Vulcanococcus limneticus TaxID=2170428 RepID=UPI00398BF9E0
MSETAGDETLQEIRWSRSSPPFQSVRQAGSDKLLKAQLGFQQRFPQRFPQQ